MRKIHFVIGPAGSGKSTYIAKDFKGYICLDIWHYQKHLTLGSGTTAILRSYATHRRDCINIANAIKGDFVIEHTLLRPERRKYYIDKLKKFGSLICHYTTDTGWFSEAELVYKHPTLEEGFNELIEVIRNDKGNSNKID